MRSLIAHLGFILGMSVITATANAAAKPTSPAPVTSSTPSQASAPEKTASPTQKTEVPKPKLTCTPLGHRGFIYCR
nr:hypothetical protein [Paenalcaligenes hominis]